MSTVKRVVVIGGAAAGPKAASRARRFDQNAEITIIQKSPNFSMASCGYPYYVGGTFDNRGALISTPTGVERNAAFFQNAKAITAIPSAEVTTIDRDKREVTYKILATGETKTLPYDKLVIATGATPFIPPVPGTDLKGISTLQSMADVDFLRKARDEKLADKAVIVGGGLIGIETAEALRESGMDVTLVEMLPQLLSFMDWEMAKLVENHIVSKGVKVLTSTPVTEFIGTDGKLSAVKLKDGTQINCQLAVIATGVKPRTELAKACGLEIGSLGGVVVNEFMQTSDPDIFAAGDCTEIPHLITGKKVHAPFGDLANLEGRVVGRNLIEGPVARFAGTLQTGVCKIFDYSAGATGLSERSARESGYDIETIVHAAPDKPGFMGGKPLIVKLVADRSNGRMLGMQCVGMGDVSKRLAMGAMTLHGERTVADLCVADLPYAPPFSPAIDNLITAAHVLENKMEGRLHGISTKEVKAKLDAGKKPYLLDTRGPDEYEVMRLGVGETLIPLGALRKRIEELPADKDTEIICYCKISLRGYEAALVLQSRGYTNVKVMEGGIIAWPYKREK